MEVKGKNLCTLISKVKSITVPDTQKFALFVQHNTLRLSDTILAE